MSCGNVITIWNRYRWLIWCIPLVSICGIWGTLYIHHHQAYRSILIKLIWCDIILLHACRLLYSQYKPANSSIHDGMTGALHGNFIKQTTLRSFDRSSYSYTDLPLSFCFFFCFDIDCRVLCWIEMCARSIKEILRDQLRKKMAELKLPLEEPYRYR